MSKPAVSHVGNRYKVPIIFDGKPNANGEYKISFPSLSNVTKISACDIVLMFDDNVVAEFPFGFEFNLTNEGNVKGESQGVYNNKFVFFPDESPSPTVLRFCPHRACTSQVQKAYHNLLKINSISFRLARYDNPEAATYPLNVRVYAKFSVTCVGWPSNSQVQTYAY